MPSGRPSETVKSGVIAALAQVVLLWSSAVSAHDASAWGGLFRSRDHGATWFLASPGTYPTAAIALAVSPTDGSHLLLATDTGLLRSRNGGRDWSREAPSVLTGAVFAAAFAGDGQRALVSTATEIFRSDADNDWRPTRAPRVATPARASARVARCPSPTRRSAASARLETWSSSRRIVGSSARATAASAGCRWSTTCPRTSRRGRSCATGRNRRDCMRDSA